MRESRHPTMAHALAVLAAHDDALLHANNMPMDTASSSTKVNCRKRTSLKCANSPVPASTPMKNGGASSKLVVTLAVLRIPRLASIASPAHEIRATYRERLAPVPGMQPA